MIANGFPVGFPETSTETRRLKMQTMKIIGMELLAVIAALAMAAAPLLFAAPAAHADQQHYLGEVQSKVQAPLTNAQALKLGNVACAAIRDGINSGLSMGKARSQADQAVGYASQSLGVGLSEADGMNLVDIADQQLC
jgi:hypothetical protein